MGHAQSSYPHCVRQQIMYNDRINIKLYRNNKNWSNNNYTSQCFNDVIIVWRELLAYNKWYDMYDISYDMIWWSNSTTD